MRLIKGSSSWQWKAEIAAAFEDVVLVKEHQKDDFLSRRATKRSWDTGQKLDKTR